MLKFLSYIFIFLMYLSINIYSQSETTMKEIIEIANDKVHELESNKQEIVNMTIDLVSGNGVKSIYRYLDPTYTYHVQIMRDSKIDEIKLSVKKAGTDSWEFVTEKGGKDPLITIHPTEACEYQFNISTDKWNGNNNAGHFAFILYHIDPTK